MNPKIICLLGALSLALSGIVLAAGAKTYQITGTVVEATGSKVTVEKRNGAIRIRYRSSYDERFSRTESRIDRDGDVRHERDENRTERSWTGEQSVVD